VPHRIIFCILALREPSGARSLEPSGFSGNTAEFVVKFSGNVCVPISGRFAECRIVSLFCDQLRDLFFEFGLGALLLHSVQT